MIMGAARAEGTVVASNCQLGGTILGEYNIEDESHEQINLTSANYFNHIYGSGVNTDWAGTTNYDGCVFLSEKPTIQ